MKVSLVVMNPGKTAGHAIPITLTQFIIGRDPQCNLRPASPVISKRHCAILIKNGKVSVRDFDSTNGTFIGDTQVKGEVPLNHDNILKVGPLTFKVVIENVPVDKQTPPPAKKLPGNEDDVANMLLSLQENEEEISTAESDEAESVPGGSTVMDMQAMPSMTSLADSPPPNRSLTPPPKSAVPQKPVTQLPKSPPPKSVTPPPPPKSATPPPPTIAPEPEAEVEEEAAAEPEPVVAETAREPVVREQPKKPEEKKPDDKKPPAHANARDAARAILEKYVKRNRGGK